MTDIISSECIIYIVINVTMQHSHIYIGIAWPNCLYPLNNGCTLALNHKVIIKYSTIFATCNFSTNCVDNVLLHSSYLNQYLCDFRQYFTRFNKTNHYICEYINLRNNSVHAIRERVICMLRKLYNMLLNVYTT